MAAVNRGDAVAACLLAGDPAIAVVVVARERVVVVAEVYGPELARDVLRRLEFHFVPP